MKITNFELERIWKKEGRRHFEILSHSNKTTKHLGQCDPEQERNVGSPEYKKRRYLNCQYLQYSNARFILQQCGPHAKDVDYTWPRQSMVAKQGYEVSPSLTSRSTGSTCGCNVIMKYGLRT
jgi:hypothetical protein